MISNELLVPRPRELRPGSGHLALGAGIRLELRCDPPGVTAALDRLWSSLRSLPVTDTGSGATLRLELAPGAFEPQAYRLDVEPSGMVLTAADERGLSHALATLRQLLLAPPVAGSELALPCLHIEDSPDVPTRGVVLDISRGRVPTMERLFSLVDRLAGWKLNQLQLYTEHTFAYRGHETVWRDASPITPEEARRLDAYCRERHVELVANQNSFGHLHRWLRHPAYRSLAECPEGVEHPFSEQREPFSLCPLDPRSLELLADLYTQLVPNFSSPWLHVGFDETFDLGQGRSSERASRVGITGLYADFLVAVHELAARHGRRIQFWGDIVASHPEILERVPTDSMVMEWGYEADHPFDERAARLAAAGLEFQLCPGTSSWLSFAGRLSNAAANIVAAVEEAVEHGAAGVSVTDWGDRGHLQPPAASEPGFLLAAATAWNRRAAPRQPDQLAPLLDLHAFGHTPGTGPGRTLLALADLYRLPGATTFNGSPLFFLLTGPELPLDHPRLRGLSRRGLGRCRELLEDLPEGGDDTPWREIRWSRDALALATRIGLARLDGRAHGATAELPVARRRELARAVHELIERHGPLWHRSSRPGGFNESVGVLERARRDLLPDERPGAGSG